MPGSGWLAIGTVGVALLAPLLASPTPIVALCLAVLMLCRIVPARRQRLRGPALLAVGGLLVASRLLVLPAPPPEAARIPDGDGPWNAVVESVAPVRDGAQIATLMLLDPSSGRVAATVPRYPEIQPGMRVSVSGGVRPPPDGPYGEYLGRTGVMGTLRSRTLEIGVTPTDPLVALERLRRGAGEGLAAAIPEPAAGLAAGIVVGLRDQVDRAVAADFTTVGASHIVAISGWNIAIVAASVASLAGGLARRRRAVLTLVSIVVYVLFAGASASVVRAAAMAGVVLLARESGRAGRAAAALGWAAVLLILADPRIAADAGFQLSALATGGILAWASPLSAWLSARSAGRAPGWLVECLAVSLAAQAATLPVVLLAFGRLSVVSPVVNLIVVPLVAPAMAAAGIALIGGIVATAGGPLLVATLAGLPAWFLLSVIIAVIRAGAQLPFASVALEPPWNAVGAITSAAVPVVALHARRWQATLRARDRAASATRAAMASGPRAAAAAPSAAPRHARLIAIALAASLVAVGLAAVHRPDGIARITVLDVGQGDAILIEGGRGGRLLVDGGPDPDRLLVELDARLPPWDRRIDAVILTHPHEDHVAGLPLILDRYRVGQVFEPGMRGPGPGYGAWAEILARDDAPGRGRLATGDRLAVDDVALDVLWPDPGRVPPDPGDSGRSINDVSIVLLGKIDGRRFLLTGDVEDDVDPILAERGLPAIDFLKVAHHGSATATTGAFIGSVDPALAVISAGADNPYGHPSPSTIERLAGSGATVLRTDTDGSVEVAFRAGTMTVAATGGRRMAETPSQPRVAAVPFTCAVPSAG